MASITVSERGLQPEKHIEKDEMWVGYTSSYYFE